MGQLLLVDDDPDLILAQINQVFGGSQHRIDVARTGTEGIRRVAERRRTSSCSTSDSPTSPGWTGRRSTGSRRAACASPFSFEMFFRTTIIKVRRVPRAVEGRLHDRLGACLEVGAEQRPTRLRGV